MRRRLLWSLVFTFVVSHTIGLGSGYAHADTFRPRHNRVDNVRVCPVKWWTSLDANRRLVVCEAHLFGVNARTAVRVARCESTFKWWERYNGFAGTFQHGIRWWPKLIRHFAVNFYHSIYNSRTNVVVAMKLVRAGGWDSWTCY